ncbi:MAG: NAD(P)-binding protein [Rhodoblastus sp.]
MVGGGIGGLAASLALVRQGFDVTVLEQVARDRRNRRRHQLGPNAFQPSMPLASARRARGRAVYVDEMIMRWPLIDGALVGRIPTSEAFHSLPTTRPRRHPPRRYPFLVTGGRAGNWRINSRPTASSGSGS